MSLVNHNMLKGDAFEYVVILNKSFVIGEQNVEFRDVGLDNFSISTGIEIVELVVLADEPALIFSFVIVHQAVEVGPCFYFFSPLMQCGQRGQYQEGSKSSFVHE